MTLNESEKLTIELASAMSQSAVDGYKQLYEEMKARAEMLETEVERLCEIERKWNSFQRLVAGIINEVI